ncbi:MAG: ATP-binding cassette domain-containing protein [Chlorobi bacterium]|nr:ATP-binding cassette domain-containing protein [Chlorobiota bacterium]
MEEKAIIVIQDLLKRYKNTAKNALDSLNLKVKQGDIYGLLGPNGAGKTSTISMLCGLLPPDSGEIIINGTNLRSKPDKVKAMIGVVPQEIALFEDLTAKENLMFFGRMHGLKKDEINRRGNDLLEKFSLTEKSNKRVKTFSGGMKRRLNLMVGIIHGPEILFLDEPSVGIDVQSKNVIIEYLKEINRSGTTIIYTSHLMEEAEKFCTEISIIDFGREITKGKPSELLENNKDCENLEDVFLKLTGRNVRE